MSPGPLHCRQEAAAGGGNERLPEAVSFGVPGTRAASARGGAVVTISAARGAAGAVALLLLAACGAVPGSAPAATHTAATQSAPTSTPAFPTSTGTTMTSPTDPTSPPPLSSIPPPTLGRPTAPPSEPSDRVRPVSLTGSAFRDPRGCIVLRSGSESYELVGPAADEALAHASVTVKAVLQPAVRSVCDYPVMRVWSVTAAT